MYTPNPIDTSNIVLPKELLELTEKIAENVHEVWAQGRIKEGWTYGPKRDDSTKETPCMVPYSELSESEKEYDRNTAMETIKLIVSYFEEEHPSLFQYQERIVRLNTNCVQQFFD